MHSWVALFAYVFLFFLTHFYSSNVMSFLSLLVILFYGALADLRLFITCVILISHSRYLRYKLIYNYNLCDHYRSPGKPVVVLALHFLVRRVCIEMSSHAMYASLMLMDFANFASGS
jgi:hypothetical protein